MERFAALFPGKVEVEVSTVDEPADSLFPEELAHIAGVVPKRSAEFTSGRACARRALARLGLPAAPILTGAHREPLWPPGVVGSITHCDGLRAAAVAYEADLASIGIDAEVNEPLPAGTLDLLTVGEELRMLAALSSRGPLIAWERVLFSAKESIYKAWYPLTSRWLDFTECELTLRIDGTFSGRIVAAGAVVDGRSLGEFDGRWGIAGDHIVTGVCVPR